MISGAELGDCIGSRLCSEFLGLLDGTRNDTPVIEGDGVRTFGKPSKGKSGVGFGLNVLGSKVKLLAEDIGISSLLVLAPIFIREAKNPEFPLVTLRQVLLTGRRLSLSFESKNVALLKQDLKD